MYLCHSDKVKFNVSCSVFTILVFFFFFFFPFTAWLLFFQFPLFHFFFLRCSGLLSSIILPKLYKETKKKKRS
jgi:hypothetical protein